MPISYEQIRADNNRMKQFVAERIPDEGIRIVLADGPEGWPAWADLYPLYDDEYGWDLSIETNEPEWVGLTEIYDHFRRREMTSWEWQRELTAEMNRWKVRSLEGDLSVLRRDVAQVVTTGPHGCATTVEEDGLPKEVSTAETARILGVSKDTVLKLKEAGLLEYRNMAPPTSLRPVYAFSLKSVLKLRTTYETDEPAPYREKEQGRRAIRGERKYKHLRLEH